MSTTIPQPRDYSDLINGEAVRSTMRRLFTNNVSEVLGELLQNAQRAGASFADITPTDDAELQAWGFTYQDDGCGLGGVDGFHTLLRIAESEYAPEVMSQQHPMGVGFHALLAHNDVAEVRIESGEHALVIDTQRWWDDIGYCKGWVDRLETLATPRQGLFLRVTTHKALGYKIVERLPLASEVTWEGPMVLESLFDLPAVGYAGTLEVRRAGTPVLTDLAEAKAYDPEAVLLRGTYEDASFFVVPETRSYYGGGSVVTFYGQAIPLTVARWTGFRVFVDVRGQRVVNPMSPSRKGLIEDAAYHKLVEHVADSVFAWAADPANRAAITPALMRSLAKMSPTRVRHDLPYFLGRPLVPAATLEDNLTLSTGDDGLEVLSYAEHTGLVIGDRDVMLTTASGTAHWFNHGLLTLLRGAGLQGHYLECGNIERLSSDQGATRVEWLLPELPTGSSWLTHIGAERGTLKLVFGNGNVMELALTGNVCAFNRADEIKRLDYVIGSDEPATVFETVGPLMGDPSLYGLEHEAFQAGVMAKVRELRGGAIPADFKLSDLTKHLPEGAVITEIRPGYNRSGSLVEMHVRYQTPDSDYVYDHTLNVYG